MSNKKEATKEELVKEVSQLLGVELKSLEMMTREDLISLRDILFNPADLVQVAIRGRKPAITTIDELIRNPIKGLQFLFELDERQK